jgi:hypothetical protein
MALIDKIQDSNLGLKGRTPAVREGATKASKVHVEDPTPGVQGDEIFSKEHSQLDLDGQIPKNTYRANAPEGASF